MIDSSTTICTWTVADTYKEARDTQSLILEPQGQMPNFIAGQYVTVLLPNREPVEGKSYSVSSIPADPQIRLTVKTIGSFSEAIARLQTGDILRTTAPYGFFYPEPGESRPIVCIAGGIGITPLISIIRDKLNTGFHERIVLFYSNKTSAETAFYDTLCNLEEKFSSFTVHHHLTREHSASYPHTPKRISGSDISSKISDFSATDFFVCGSIPFTKDLWQTLRNIGVPSNQIYTEGFF
jgi:uncharacterized protein